MNDANAQRDTLNLFHAKLALASIDRIGDAAYWLDASARVIYVNEAACDMLGYTFDEFRSMTIFDIDMKLPRETWSRGLDGLQEAGTIHFESVHTAKDGREIPVEVASLATNIDGVQYSFSYCRDITKRKAIETELEAHRNDLEGLVAERTKELQRALEELLRKEKLAALGNLVAGVAHELNTPLGNARMVASSLDAIVDGFLESMESGSLRRSDLDAFVDRIRGATRLLERNTGRAAELIEQFKLVAVDQSSERRRLFNLAEMVDDLLSTIKPQFKHSGVEVQVEIPKGITLDSYPGPLGQVLANLLENSLAHGFADTGKGRVSISAKVRSRARVTIIVADDGCGIPEEIEPRIYEPFFTTRLGSGGSGLGLYLVHTIVTDVLGGTVKLERHAGTGASFAIDIPNRAP